MTVGLVLILGLLTVRIMTKNKDCRTIDSRTIYSQTNECRKNDCQNNDRSPGVIGLTVELMTVSHELLLHVFTL